MNFFSFIVQDWKVNHANIKGRLVLIMFRIANFCSKKRIYFYLGLPYLAFYKFFVEWVLSIEIPYCVQIGKNFALYHGQGTVINQYAIIGNNCTIRHCTTIGNKQTKNGFSKAPVLEDFVDVGSNVCIIGDVTIGTHVMVGCGAVVTKNVSPNCIVVGNPAVEKRRAPDKILEPALNTAV